MRYLFLSLLFFTTTLFASEIVVKPGGSIATLERARDAVRVLRAKGEMGDINVIIHDGIFTLDKTLVFGLKDAAPEGAVTRYRAADGAHPLISGGREIRNWERTKLANGNIWVAKVPWAKGDAFFHCLFDGNQFLKRAQSDPITITNKDPQKKEYLGPLNYRYEFGFKPGQLKHWENMQDIELFGSPTRLWMVNYLPIESLDLKANQGILSIPATYKMSGEFVVENCIDYLDKPGEWVLNSQERKLYYWPEAGTPGDHIIAPLINELIRVEGEVDSSVTGTKDKPVEGIVFEGLEFSYADRQQWLPNDIGLQHDWDMWDKANGLLRFRGAKNCEVKNCSFVNSGSDGVRMDLFCQNNKIEDCTFRNLGGTGVLLCGYGPGMKDVNKYNIIHNNEISQVGSLFFHSPGIFIWQSGYNRITNNHIHDLAYTGLVVSGVRRRCFAPVFNKMGKPNPFKQWIFPEETRENIGTIRWDEIKLEDIENWSSYQPYMHSRNNLIEYNEVHDCLKLLHDGNCIYLSANGDGNIVRHNVTYNHPEGAMIRTDDDILPSVIN